MVFRITDDNLVGQCEHATIVLPLRPIEEPDSAQLARDVRKEFSGAWLGPGEVTRLEASIIRCRLRGAGGSYESCRKFRINTVRHIAVLDAGSDSEAFDKPIEVPDVFGIDAAAEP